MRRDPGGGGGDDRSEAEPEADAGDDRGPEDVGGEGAAWADQAEPGEPGRGQQPADDQQGPRSETVAELDREHGAGDHAEGERQEHDPGQRRPDPEHSLEVEGHEIEGRGHGRTDQEVVRVRAGYRAVGQQAEPDQRFAGGGPLDVDERGQQRGGDRQGRQRHRRGPRVLVGADDAEHQQGHARRGQDGTEHIQPAPANRRRAGGTPRQARASAQRRSARSRTSPSASRRTR